MSCLKILVQNYTINLLFQIKYVFHFAHQCDYLLRSYEEA